VIVQILDWLGARVESAGLAFNGFALNGSNEPAQCTWGEVDPDHIRDFGLQAGIEYQGVSDPRVLPKLGTPVQRNIGSELAPIWQLESAYSNVRRELLVHLYMREIRPELDRDVGFDVVYLENEEKLLGVLDIDQTRETLVISGIPREFVFEFGTVAYRAKQGITKHAVLTCAVEYPLLTSIETEQIHLAEAITLRGVTPVPLPAPTDVYPEREITQ
jgi:hypothetical protein